jgi:hypothetical protein
MSDELSGCDLDFREAWNLDDEIDSIVLFADIDDQDKDAVSKRKSEWEAILNAS